MSEEVLGILCSGRGSNLQSIIENVNSGKIKAKISVVLTDKPNAAALLRAKEAGILGVCVDRKLYETREAFEEALLAKLREAGVTLVILAGFMRLLSPLFVRAYEKRIMNIHPALLPSFQGAHAHRDVLSYGVKVTGATVHFVDEGMDSGPIILQDTVPVLDNDTEETLAARVLKIEHRLYPEAIRLFVEGRLKIEGRKVRIAE